VRAQAARPLDSPVHLLFFVAPALYKLLFSFEEADSTRAFKDIVDVFATDLNAVVALQIAKNA
jgi:hypothetical protein